jgi:hypothetical protein
MLQPYADNNDISKSVKKKSGWGVDQKKKSNKQTNK